VVLICTLVPTSIDRQAPHATHCVPTLS